MRCSKTRKRLQEWFDKPVSPLPPDVAEHVRNCTDCRSLVTRWNAIELELQAMKGEGPILPADFAASVRKRLRQPDVRAPWRMPAYAWRFATAGAAVLVAAAALLYVLGGMRILFPTARPGSAAYVPPGEHTLNHNPPR